MHLVITSIVLFPPLSILAYFTFNPTSFHSYLIWRISTQLDFVIRTHTYKAPLLHCLFFCLLMHRVNKVHHHRRRWCQRAVGGAVTSTRVGGGWGCHRQGIRCVVDGGWWMVVCGLWLCGRMHCLTCEYSLVVINKLKNKKKMHLGLETCWSQAPLVTSPSPASTRPKGWFYAIVWAFFLLSVLWHVVVVVVNHHWVMLQCVHGL